MSARRIRVIVVLLLPILIALSLAPFAGADEGHDHGGHDMGGMDMSATPAAAENTDQVWPIKVDVDLAEFTVTLSQADFVVGQPYFFVVTNMGHLQHQLSVHPDDGMGGMDMGGMDMHHGEGALVDITLDPLTVWSGVVTFEEPGTYMAMCHLPGHEAMMVMFEVAA